MTLLSNDIVARPSDTDGTIVLDNVSMDFTTRDGGGIRAVDNTKLQIESGQFVSVLGPSGCGKSTLLRMIAGLITPTGGSVMIGGEKVTGPSRRVGIAFQQPVLFPWFTIRENIRLPAKIQKIASAQVIDERVDELLETIQLSNLGDKYPNELSGGMRQRVAIARSLITRPSVMLMDEPFGALDAITKEHMHDELLNIWDHTNATVFFITHDISEAVYLSDRVLVMSPRPGSIVADITIDLPRPRGDETRRDPEFTALAAAMRDHIAH